MTSAARRPGYANMPQLTLAGLEAPSDEPKPLRRSALTLRDVAAWSRRQVRWIAQLGQAERSSELFVFTQAAKLVEEVGELHAELLGRAKAQRRSKAQQFDASSLGGELADVVLATAVLAVILDVDLAAAVKAKMDIVDSRVAAEPRAL